jgi:hypothetical protein
MQPADAASQAQHHYSLQPMHELGSLFLSVPTHQDAWSVANVLGLVGARDAAFEQRLLHPPSRPVRVGGDAVPSGMGKLKGPSVLCSTSRRASSWLYHVQVGMQAL